MRGGAFCWRIHRANGAGAVWRRSLETLSAFAFADLRLRESIVLDREPSKNVTTFHITCELRDGLEVSVAGAWAYCAFSCSSV